MRVDILFKQNFGVVIVIEFERGVTNVGILSIVIYTSLKVIDGDLEVLDNLKTLTSFF